MAKESILRSRIPAPSTPDPPWPPSVGSSLESELVTGRDDIVELVIQTDDAEARTVRVTGVPAGSTIKAIRLSQPE